jgi:hypothetical protein
VVIKQTIKPTPKAIETPIVALPLPSKERIIIGLILPKSDNFIEICSSQFVLTQIAMLFTFL